MNKKTIGTILLWLGFVSGAMATVSNAPGKGVKHARSMRDAEQVPDDLSRAVVWSSALSVLQPDESKKEEDKTEAEVKEAKALVAYGNSLNVILVSGFKPKLIDSESAEPVQADGWHLINWTWYSLSFLVGVAGVVAIRMGTKESTQKSEKTKSSLAEIKECLNRLVINTAQLAKDSKELAPSKILARIDDDLGDDFRLFAEGRESMSAEFGLNVYADVMTNFASGERAVNRAWSASADGYVNEAEACLERGLQMLQEAYDVLNKA